MTQVKEICRGVSRGEIKTTAGRRAALQEMTTAERRATFKELTTVERRATLGELPWKRLFRIGRQCF